MKISSKKYALALAEALRKNADKALIIKNLLNLLRRKKQSKLLSKILQAFEEIWNEMHGIIKMEVSCPKKFKSSMQILEKLLTERTGKKMVFKQKIDDSIIGGFYIRSGDTLIDASLKGRLKVLENHLIT